MSALVALGTYSEPTQSMSRVGLFHVCLVFLGGAIWVFDASWTCGASSPACWVRHVIATLCSFLGCNFASKVLACNASSAPQVWGNVQNLDWIRFFRICSCTFLAKCSLRPDVEIDRNKFPSSPGFVFELRFYGFKIWVGPYMFAW